MPQKPWIDRQHWWVPLLLIFASLLFSYRSIIAQLISQWISNEDYSHGMLILPISIYLAWEKRERLKAAVVHTDWLALPLLMLAVIIYIVGELGAELFTARVSLIVLLIGSIWLLFGKEVLRELRFPLLFLFLMLPLPGLIYRKLTFPLQLLSSEWSVHLLHLLGVSAYREGNVIDMGFSQFQVVEACNGLRFILPMLTLGILFAYWGHKPLWHRFLLVIVTVPISILANVFRIAGTGIAAMHWGPEVAEGFFHSFSGWAVFMVSFGLFLIFNLMIKWIPGKPRQGQVSQVDHRHKAGSGAVAWIPLAIGLLIILAAPPLVGALGSVTPVQLKRPLTEFPLEMNGRLGKPSTMPSEIWEQVGGQDYVLIDYTAAGKLPINFYAAFYEHQRKAGDFIHSPRLCLPGAGWFIQENRARSIPPDKSGAAETASLKFNEMLIDKNEQVQLVYFWYQGRGRNFTSEYAAKFYMVWDGIFHRRTDGALVRLIMPLSRETPMDDARTILDSFAQRTAMELERFLP